MDFGQWSVKVILEIQGHLEHAQITSKNIPRGAMVTATV
jgi:hypothetical protein